MADWFEPLSIDVTGVHKIQHQFLQSMLEDHSEVFGELGACRRPPVSVAVDPDVAPKFFKVRPVPFELDPKVYEALDRLVEQGVVVSVRHSRWATPIVPISKKDWSL